MFGALPRGARWRLPSIAATARRYRVEPISLHGFVGPEIDGHLHRRRQPDELFAEVELGAGFLKPRETDLEVSRGVDRTPRCIDRHDGGPPALQCRRLHR